MAPSTETLRPRSPASTRARPIVTGTIVSMPGMRASASASSSVSLRCAAAEDAGDAERLRLAGVDGHDVGAELRELRQHVDARALADRGQQDHRRHADRDPEHREERAQAMRARGRRARAGRGRARAQRPASAATGSSRVARRAGSTPNTPPTATESEKAARDRPGGRRGGQRRVDRDQRQHGGPAERRGRAGRPPRRSGPPPPGTPPGSGRARRRAPSAGPTSRVRSETETSITFMMPTPATASEIAAIPPSAIVSAPRIELEGRDHRVLRDDGDVFLAVALASAGAAPPASRRSRSA